LPYGNNDGYWPGPPGCGGGFVGIPLARKLRRTLTEPTDDEDPADLTRLQQSWSEFVSQGGTTREDLVRFIHGEQLGSTVHVKGHLRLVRSNPEQERDPART
jgi:hypothetical protein